MSLQFTRVVVDENVPNEVVQNLRQMGFKEVYPIGEMKPGISDPEVWRLAMAKDAILITGDIRFLPQLDEIDVLQGPIVLEYSTNGFNKSELQDPEVMKMLVKWLFDKGHHNNREHIKIFIEGTERTRRQLWGQEKARRKRQA